MQSDAALDNKTGERAWQQNSIQLKCNRISQVTLLVVMSFRKDKTLEKLMVFCFRDA